MLPALLGLLATASAADIPLSVATEGETHRISAGAAFPASIASDLQTRLDGIADATCGSLKVRWGRYDYGNYSESDGTVYIENYVQRFKCFDPATDPYKPVAGDWQGTPEDEEAVHDVVQRYYNAITDGDAAAGIALLDPEYEIDATDWLAVTSLLRDPGPGEAEITYFNWLANPESMPHPGGFADLRITGYYDDYVKACVDIVLYRDAPGHFLVTSMSLNGLLRQDADSVTQAQIDSICA